MWHSIYILNMDLFHQFNKNTPKSINIFYEKQSTNYTLQLHPPNLSFHVPFFSFVSFIWIQDFPDDRFIVQHICICCMGFSLHLSRKHFCCGGIAFALHSNGKIMLLQQCHDFPASEATATQRAVWNMAAQMSQEQIMQCSSDDEEHNVPILRPCWTVTLTPALCLQRTYTGAETKIFPRRRVEKPLVRLTNKSSRLCLETLIGLTGRRTHKRLK